MSNRSLILVAIATSTTKWLNLVTTLTLLVSICGCQTTPPINHPDSLEQVEREIGKIEAEQRSAAEQQAKKDDARVKLCSDQDAKCMGPLWDFPFDRMNGDQMAVSIKCNASLNDCMGVKPSSDETCNDFEICDPDDRICALQKQVCDLKKQVEEIQNSAE